LYHLGIKERTKAGEGSSQMNEKDNGEGEGKT